MLKFNHYLVESKNTHMEHIEDMVFNDGVNGARLAITSLQRLRNMLAGNSTKEFDITVKWDGAPAIFAGIDPTDGKFFVAKKGIFNKTPQLFKTEKDIDAQLSGDLADKFKYALREFAKLGIKSGVYQGDLMFTKSDLKKESHDGVDYLTFQPNTIVYAVEKNSHLGKVIARSQIGVVWHTTYTGRSFETMKASFGKSITAKFKSIPSVWMDDANYKDQSGKATFTKAETIEVTNYLSKAGKLLNQLPAEFLNLIAEDEEVRSRVKTFLNKYVRAGTPFPDPKQMSIDLHDDVVNYYKLQADKVKTERGKSGVTQKLERVMKVLSRPVELQSLFEFFNNTVQAKLLIINKLHKAEGLGTFLRTSNGLKVTDREGYVAIDRLKGGAVKLVDRMEFSKANFSSDVIKGWQK
jgi:hypothetical protein